MSTNFQLIEAHNVDIENFNYDVSTMVDSIYIGPQGELLEKLEQFNHTFGSNIGVTKNFTLKPGGYDEIKKAHARFVLRHDLKPRGIKSLFDRIQNYGWRYSGFKQQILNIETRMQSLKASGMRWQNNTNQFIEEFNKLKASIINALEEVRNMYSFATVECKIVPVSEGRLTASRSRYYGDREVFPDNMFDESDNEVDFIIMFYIKIKNADLMVHVMEEDVINEYRIPMGDICIASGTYLLPLISRNWNRTTPRTGHPSNTRYSFFLETIYLSKIGDSAHPYIGKSNDHYAFELNSPQYSGNICTGNMANDIRTSLLNNEIMAHITNLITWVTTYYVPQTNPLNRINKMRVYGDDIKFIQWRNDLNSTSTGVFTTLGSDLPEQCGYGVNIYHCIYSYATNTGSNNRYYRNDRYTEDDAEYPLRLKEYINKISLNDMSCNNCGFKSECSQWNVLQLIFQESLTYEEEACFGMLYEMHEFLTNIMHRTSNDNYREIHFAELALMEAWRWNLDWDYLKFTMCHKMCIWWATINGESFTATSTRYRRRAKTLYNMTDKNFKHLFEYHYLNEKSEIVWTVSNIQDYRAPQDNETEETTVINDTIVEDWLNSEEPMPFDTPNMGRPTLIEDEDMTAEQRSIRWAIQNGGANNL